MEFDRDQLASFAGQLQLSKRRFGGHFASPCLLEIDGGRLKFCLAREFGLSPTGKVGPEVDRFASLQASRRPRTLPPSPQGLSREPEAPDGLPLADPFFAVVHQLNPPLENAVWADRTPSGRTGTERAT